MRKVKKIKLEKEKKKKRNKIKKEYRKWYKIVFILKENNYAKYFSGYRVKYELQWFNECDWICYSKGTHVSAQVYLWVCEMICNNFT